MTNRPLGISTRALMNPADAMPLKPAVFAAFLFLFGIFVNDADAASPRRRTPVGGGRRGLLFGFLLFGFPLDRCQQRTLFSSFFFRTSAGRSLTSEHKRSDDVDRFTRVSIDPDSSLGLCTDAAASTACSTLHRIRPFRPPSPCARRDSVMPLLTTSRSPRMDRRTASATSSARTSQSRRRKVAKPPPPPPPPSRPMPSPTPTLPSSFTPETKPTLSCT